MNENELMELVMSDDAAIRPRARWLQRERIIEAARAYAVRWSEGYQVGEPRQWGDPGEYDEGPVTELEELLTNACPCGCGRARLVACKAQLKLPHETAPSDVPSELARYVELIAVEVAAIEAFRLFPLRDIEFIRMNHG